jgi:hypothetical protein
MICLAIIFIIKLGHKIHLMNLIKSLLRLRLFYVLEECVDWNASCFSGQMLSFFIANSLIIVVETHFLCCHKSETSHFDSVLFSQSDEISSVLLFRIGIVNYDTFPFENLFFCHFVTFFFCLQRVSIHTRIF